MPNDMYDDEIAELLACEDKETFQKMVHDHWSNASPLFQIMAWDPGYGRYYATTRIQEGARFSCGCLTQIKYALVHPNNWDGPMYPRINGVPLHDLAKEIAEDPLIPTCEDNVTRESLPRCAYYQRKFDALCEECAYYQRKFDALCEEHKIFTAE